MNRRFVIAAEGLTPDQEKQLRDFLMEHGPWWHWIDNVWLLSARSDEESLSAASIRDRIAELNEEARILVFEFPEDIGWATRGKKNAKGRKMSDWIHNTWDQD